MPRSIDDLVAAARERYERVDAVTAAREQADGAIVVDTRPEAYRRERGEIGRRRVGWYREHVRRPVPRLHAEQRAGEVRRALGFRFRSLPGGRSGCVRGPARRSRLSRRARLAQCVVGAMLGILDLPAQLLLLLLERVEPRRELGEPRVRRRGAAARLAALEVDHVSLDLPKLRDRDAAGRQREGQDKRCESPIHPISSFASQSNLSSRRAHLAARATADTAPRRGSCRRRGFPSGAAGDLRWNRSRRCRRCPGASS